MCCLTSLNRCVFPVDGYPEPMRTLKISDADRSTEIEDNSPLDTDNKSSDSHTTTASSANIHSPGDDHMDDSSDGGTIAAVVVSLVVVLVAAGVVAVCWMNKRRKQSLSCEALLPFLVVVLLCWLLNVPATC